MAAIAQFLKENDLSVDTTVEVFITVTRDDRLIACGGIAGNIIKCVAICESVRGEGLARLGVALGQGIGIKNSRRPVYFQQGMQKFCSVFISSHSGADDQGGTGIHQGAKSG